MARDVLKNLTHILIRAEDTVQAFQIRDDIYEVSTTVPASAIIALTVAESPVAGMRDYIIECIPDEAQKIAFGKLMKHVDVDGLSAIVEAIVEATTPFAGAKPSA